MLDISVANFENAEVHTIAIGNRKLFWVRMYDVQKGLGIKNISDLVRKEIHGIFENHNHIKDQIRKHKRSGKEWFSGDAYTYVRSDLMLEIIKIFRGEKGRGEKKIDDFQSQLGFKLHDLTMSKEESVTTKIIKAFPNDEILLQHKVLDYFIDLYFPDHKLAIEVDKKGHTDRDEKKKGNEREKK